MVETSWLQISVWLTSAIVSAAVIVGILRKFAKWLRKNPIKTYIEQIALDKLSREKLISIYDQLDSTDIALLKKYKQDEDRKTKTITNISEYDDESHIKIKYLGLINEIVNNKESQARIRSLVENGFSVQWNLQKIEDDLSIKNMYEQQITQLKNSISQNSTPAVAGNNSLDARNVALQQINGQHASIYQRMQQRQIQLKQLQDLHQQMKLDSPQIQQLLDQIKQISLEISQLQQQLNQLNQLHAQLVQAQNTETQLQSLTKALDNLENTIKQREEENNQTLQAQFKAPLVIDLSITKTGNDILDVLNKKVTESDVKSKLEFYKYSNKEKYNQ